MSFSYLFLRWGLTTEHRLALNLQFSCFCFSSAMSGSMYILEAMKIFKIINLVHLKYLEITLNVYHEQ